VSSGLLIPPFKTATPNTLNYTALLRGCGTATNAFENLADSSGLSTRRLLLVNPYHSAKHVVAAARRWAMDCGRSVDSFRSSRCRWTGSDARRTNRSFGLCSRNAGYPRADFICGLGRVRTFPPACPPAKDFSKMVCREATKDPASAIAEEDGQALSE
jgi:hypothetical protein